MPPDLDEAVEAEPWRSMTAEDALRHLLDADAARRTMEAQAEAYRLGLGGLSNRRRLVAWRRENGLCPKCGRAIRADEAEFKHCRRCRQTFREQQRHFNASLTEPQRLARNERARKSYHKLAHGKAAPPKVVTLITPKVVTREVVTPMVTPDPMVTPVVTPPSTSTKKQTAAGPKRDRAEYMRAYRADRAKS